MSMTMLTILQICGILIAYSVVTLLLPFLLLRKRFRHYPVAEQLIFYFLAGNFYIIYLVFLLQFLHISCQFTLLAGTAIPFLIVFYRKYRGRILIGIEQIFQTVLAVLRGENGVKTLASKGYRIVVGNRGKHESDIERVDITVVAVVNQRTSVLSYLHLQSHCHIGRRQGVP